MKHRFLFAFKILIIFTLLFSFSSCNKDDDEFVTSWEEVSVSSLDFYNENITKVNDSSIGQMVLQYSFFDKNIKTSEALNNISEKTLGTNVCGFEGKFGYISGPVYEYGFLFNMNQTANTFYMVGFTKNGTLVVYEYQAASSAQNASGELIASSEGYLKNLSGDIGPALTKVDPDSRNNVIKVESFKGKILISVNGNLLYTINSPKWTRGAVGIFQRLKDSELADYKASNPLRTNYQFSKIQRH